jgi:hypothetical protein
MFALLGSTALVANSSAKAVNRSGLLVLLVGNGPVSARLHLIQVNDAGATPCHSFNCWKLTGVTTRGEDP